MWDAASKDPALNLCHRNYIVEEAKQLFRQNRNMQDIQQIRQCLREAESRLALALHYKTPYPRPVNVPHMTFATGTEGKRRMMQPQMLKETTATVTIKSPQEQ